MGYHHRATRKECESGEDTSSSSSSSSTTVAADTFTARLIRWKLTDHGLGKVGGTSRNDKEFLERKLVTGVLTTVDHVEARDRERVRDGVAGNFGVVLPERNATRSGTGLAGGQGDCKNEKKKVSVG